MNRHRLEQLTRAWQTRLVARDFLRALATASIACALILPLAGSARWQTPILVFIVTLLGCLANSRPWKLDVVQIARHLDRTCPELEESAALFLLPHAQLGILEKIQLDRVNQQVSAASSKHKSHARGLGAPPPGFLRSAWVCLCVGVALATTTGVYFFLHPNHSAPKSAVSQTATPQSSVPATTQPPLKIIGNVFTITPPVYTGQAPRQTEGFATEAEEGSTVTWQITLDRMPRDARLVAGPISSPLHPEGTYLKATQIITNSALFALAGTLPDGTAWNPPELFSIKIRKDQPPAIHIIQPAQSRTEIAPPAPGPVPVEIVITDDYAVADAHLVATVAKGSGEAVKFREQIIDFDPATTGESPRTRRFTKALDLAALGMEPGDELYFFVEAHDNHPPAANRTRSETRFIRLRGPEERPTTTGQGISGVNLIPQYFRSERQLIIDTEKLIADRSTLPDAEFRNRADSLGVDQGLLRLRYGRFLGEDQEDSPLTDHQEAVLDPLQAPVPSTATGPHAAAGIAQRFQQEHSEQDRNGGREDGPPRPPADGTPLTAAQIRQPFVDSHDQHDKNTFFDNDTKGTMRDALAAMWTAEGFLRTARPQEALAPENRALEILKDLQQSARAYVQHVGFEATPIKVAERRLKGETTDVPTRLKGSDVPKANDPLINEVRAALTALSRSDSLSHETLNSLQSSLTAAATRQPDQFLAGLQTVRQTQPGALVTPDEISQLQRALLRLLPAANPLPANLHEVSPTLANRYFDNLQNGETQP